MFLIGQVRSVNDIYILVASMVFVCLFVCLFYCSIFEAGWLLDKHISKYQSNVYK